MKTLRRLTCVVMYVLLAGCASASYSVGKDFDESKIILIDKGKTTSQEILGLFGEPFSKSVMSANQEKWLYSYSSGVATARNYVVTNKVETTGNQKTLDLLIQDGVVLNFTYSVSDHLGHVSTD